MTATDTTIADALAALGTTAKRVARTLRAGGYKGKQCAAGDCPVSRYLRDVCGIPPESYVLAGAYTVYVDGQKSAKPTRAVRNFMAEFDCGDYPDLVDVTAPTPTTDTEAP